MIINIDNETLINYVNVIPKKEIFLVYVIYTNDKGITITEELNQTFDNEKAVNDFIQYLKTHYSHYFLDIYTESKIILSDWNYSL